MGKLFWINITVHSLVHFSRLIDFAERKNYFSVVSVWIICIDIDADEKKNICVNAIIKHS
jgi:hypothetical protein